MKQPNITVKSAPITVVTCLEQAHISGADRLRVCAGGGAWIEQCKALQRLKDEQAKPQSLVWRFQRSLTQLKCKVHTDAIYKHLLPPRLTQAQRASLEPLLPHAGRMVRRVSSKLSGVRHRRVR